MTVEVSTQAYQTDIIGLWHAKALSLLHGEPLKRNQVEDRRGESRIMF
jgi:hypothetical protein